MPLIFRTVIIVAVGVLTIVGLNRYHKIPPLEVWDDVDLLMSTRGSVGQLLVICPLEWYSYARESHAGRFHGFRVRKSYSVSESIYPTYWLIGNCGGEGVPIQSFPMDIAIREMPSLPFDDPDPFIRELYRSAIVSLVHADGSAQTCPLTDGVFDCGKEEWQKIAPVHGFAKGRELTCLRTHPQKEMVLRLEFPNLPKGSLKFAFLDSFANSPDNTHPVRFVVDGDKHVEIQRSQRIATHSVLSGKPVVEVTAPDVTRKHVCVTWRRDY